MCTHVLQTHEGYAKIILERILQVVILQPLNSFSFSFQNFESVLEQKKTDLKTNSKQ